MGKKKKQTQEDIIRKAQKVSRNIEKAEKKSAKKSAKASYDPENDLDLILAKFQAEDRKLNTVSEKACNQPSSRSSATISAHPNSQELWLFGGELNQGARTFVYNDIFIYKIKTNSWSTIFVPNPPPPRCSHQTVMTHTRGGEMWVFGGEFSSPNGQQFHHYKDMWVLNLKNKEKWEQMDKNKMTNSPSARSGHRMVEFDKKLWVFGGFHERSTEFIYYNDLYSFCLTNFQWCKIVASNPNSAPSPRSACLFQANSTGLMVFGGYCKIKGKTKEKEHATLPFNGHFYNVESNTWNSLKQSGQVPEARSGFYSFCHETKSKHRVFFFGGVVDEEEDDEIDSEFFNDLHVIDASSSNQSRWFPATMRVGDDSEQYEPCPRIAKFRKTLR